MSKKKKPMFRASSIGDLMVGCKPNTPESRLTELQLKEWLKLEQIDFEDMTNAQQKKWSMLDEKINRENELSETAKTMIKKIWLRDNYGFHEFVSSKEMKKGLSQEDDSLILASKVTDRVLFKNSVRKTRFYITGEHDSTYEDTVIDVKTSWSPYTFMRANMTSGYEWQLRTYMYLNDFKKAELIYCLVDMPADIFRDLERKEFWNHGVLDDVTDEAVAITEQLKTNYVYSGNEKYKDEDMIKRFFIERDDELEKMMLEMVLKGVEYYKTLKLNIIE